MRPQRLQPHRRGGNMRTGKRWISLAVLAAALALLAAATVWAATAAQEPEPAAPLEALGTHFTYQGKLEDDGAPVDKLCQMEFRLYAGPGEFAKLVGGPILRDVTVDHGLFTVPDLDFGSTPFQGFARWLDIEVKCAGDHGFTDLGRQELTAVPYALYALDAHWDGLPYSGVVVVAKSGGDYTSVQAAIDSITTADADNPYLVWIAPGVYEEQVTMAPYVHLQGAGQEATVLSNDANAATLYLAAHASVRDLTVLNGRAGTDSIAIFASSSANVSGTLVADVTAGGQGIATWGQGIGLYGSSTSVTLLDVTAHAECDCERNYGLRIESGATAIVEGGSFAARGASVFNFGIYNHDSTLEATDVFALAESDHTNWGLFSDATATLRGGTFAAHGGNNASGIENEGSDAILEAQSVTAEGLDGGTFSYGLSNTDGGSATLHGGSFTARGGSSGTRGLYNSGTGSVLQANGVSALAEDGDYNYGLSCGSTGSAYVTLSVLEGSYKSAYGNANTQITHSRLVDGDVSGTGTTCIAVSWGTTWYENTCP
jgi:hypothetical protein